MFWSEGDGFWEREPIGWMEADGEKRWTRGVKLGALGEQGEGKKTRVSYIRLLQALAQRIIKLKNISGITLSLFPRKHQVRQSQLDRQMQHRVHSGW